MKPPQACMTTYPARLQTFSTALITPAGPTPTGPSGTPSAAERSSGRTKRGNQVVSYAEVDGDDDFENDAESRAAIMAGQAAGGPPGAIGGFPGVETIKRPVQLHPKLVQQRYISDVHRTEHQLLSASALPTVLIPIRLDIDLEPPSRGRLHDSFLWNLHEVLITPDTFALTTCLDLDLPIQPYASIISTSIRDQISEYAPVATISLPEGSGEMRVVCNLNVNLGERVYADKFEWDLAGSLTPEYFARGVARDLGLSGEFVPAIAHAIHEFCLQKKKDLCETGVTPDLENDAHRTDVEAGWRLDLESLGAEWESRVETLTREEIEKREGDREREIRRLRRDTARLGGGGSLMPLVWGATVQGDVEEQMGRGSRVKRKRQRSLSPGPTGGRGTPSRSAAPQSNGVSNGGLNEWEKQNWRCAWCGVAGTGTWGVREGPEGQKTLCFNCGTAYAETAQLPEWSKGLHAYTQQRQ